MDYVESCFPTSVSWINELKDYLVIFYDNIPGSSVIYRYIQNSYQNDPFRIVLELFLVIFAFKYLTSKKYAPDTQELTLTENEIEELINEWSPEPLVPILTPEVQHKIDNLPVIDGPVGPYIRLIDGKSYINLASFDFLGMSTVERIHQAAVAAVRKYGVGACGPPGFYGTIDVHQELEREIARFIGTEEAIIYSQAFSAVSSVIPAFAKRGDILVCDEYINFALQKGVQISRSNTKFFKHNDMHDLESVLQQVFNDSQKTGKLTRRFIVVEGIYQNSGNIVPLQKLVELKKKYKFRIIVDESLSFGVLGKRGAGLTDYFGVKPADVDIIVGSMANSLGSAGGFCAGSNEVVDHQRLSGVAYCFSAALPALLAKSALEAIEELKVKPGVLEYLKQNISTFKSIVNGTESWLVKSAKDSPIIHIYRKTNPMDVFYLNKIIDECKSKGIFVTKSEYVDDQERCRIPKSIRISINAGHQAHDIKAAAEKIQHALEKI